MARIRAFLWMELYAERRTLLHSTRERDGMRGGGDGGITFRRDVAVREVEVFARSDAVEERASGAFVR